MEDENLGTIYRSKKIGSKEPLIDYFVTYDGEKVYTLFDIFEHAAEKYGSERYLGTREDKEYKWITYNQVREQRDEIGSGLLQIGAKKVCLDYFGNILLWFIILV